MPDRIDPCLALLTSTVPTGPEWSFEVKWDGYRLAVHIDLSAVRILTRNGHDWTHRFPFLAKAARALKSSTLILDGEVVVLDAQGRSDFSELQKALGGRGGKAITGTQIVFYAFDLLYIDGHDLTGMVLEERRQILGDLLDKHTGAIRMSEDINADGNELLRLSCELGLEGIIAKHRDKPYRSGRHGEWLKIKCIMSETFAILGYEPSTKLPGAVGSLMLGALRQGELVPVGAVGTGFSNAEARALRKRLDELGRVSPPDPVARKSAVYVEPVLNAEIEFRAWTADGSLRHASYKGLRDAADADAIYVLAPPGR